MGLLRSPLEQKVDNITRRNALLANNRYRCRMADQQIFMSELATEKSTQYRGSASIKLEVLHFEHEQDLKNARKLELLFRKTGYDHLDVQNHVPAIIDKQTLETAVRDSGLTAEMLRVNPGGSYPKLDFPPGLRLECLHGQDRVQAAARLLPKKDRRWIVDLYLAGSVICLPYVAL